MAIDEIPPGEPAPSILDDRIWIDGCFDFFHHGKMLSSGALSILIHRR